jgi:hypothetical protein
MGTTIKGAVKSLAVFTALAVLGGVATHAQNTLQFTSVNATPEKAMQLHWASNSNEVYEIDYADSLIDTNTGTITWHKLYDNYPSQGSNTFWLDTGNYNAGVAHPKNSPMRFYQAVLTATNTSAANPVVSISSPTNNEVVSGNLTVSFSATSDDPIALTKLYVDGEEMKPSDDGSNFVINTCEWWNGSHTIFVTAQSQSHFEMLPADPSPVTYGRSVSGYVNVLFSNLISEVQFSQPYFEPSLGQTQEVTAQFAANCDWTLQVQDVYGNAVRNASGSGSTLVFDWDGTGDGGTNIPDGHYSFFISASTNGAPMSMMLAPSPMLSDVETMWAVPDDAETPVPLNLYPPGFDTNSLNVFEASESELATLMPVAEETETVSMPTLGTFFTPMAAGAAGSSQDTTVPTRPQNAAGKGTVGTFYVGYQTYDVPGGLFSFPAISSGNLVVNKWVILDNETTQSQASHGETFGSILDFTALANNFATTMQAAHWKGTVNSFIKKSDVEGGTFNTSNVGFLLCHGSYGHNSESDGVIRSYMRFFDTPGQPGSAVSSRLDDCMFGGAGTNGLKFMGALVCNNLQDTVYNNLHVFARLPINSDLHLFLGASTYVTAAPTLGSRWADAMLGDGTTNRLPITVEQSWYKAGRDAYDNSHGTGETNHLVIKLRVAGWPDAFPEHVTDVANNPSTGNALDITKTDSTVFNNP